MDITALLASFASAYSQSNRHITFIINSTAITPEQLLPQQLKGEEGVSRSYCFQLDCLAPDGRIELKTLLGHPARIGIINVDGCEDVRCGVISQARLLASDGGFARYGLTVEPPFALLRHRRTSRVFQDMAVPDIIKQIVSEHQAANPAFARVQTLDFKIDAAQPPRSYCLQYRESDFEFIVRLMHEEGFAWRFEHIDGNSPQVRLVVFDNVYSLPASSASSVRFHRADATEEQDGLTSWQAARQIVPGGVALASYDYQPTRTSHSSDTSQVDQGQAGQALQGSLTQYDAPGLYYASDADQLGRYAQLRKQAHDLQAKTFTGAGAVRGLQAGAWFRLDDHPAHQDDSAVQREFVVTGQRIQARNNLPGDLFQQLQTIAPGLCLQAAAPTAAPYQTEFQAQRRGIPLTPPYANTPHAKPTSLGTQTATVVGPAGEEVHTDEHGRVKVQFHWQRPEEHPTIGAGMDDKSSCWLRVAMPSAGAAWGHQFIPRIGQEVLVSFIEGDIDRPLITGLLYNGSHPPPNFSGAGSLPANKTLSGIKSKEHQGGGYSELLFDDTPGEVRAKLSSESGKTQLNQGFLTHPRSDGKAQPRGEGFELRTDSHGAVRAAHGLLLSTEAQNGASGKQLAREHAQSQLDTALNLSQSLAEEATGQQADTMETGPNEVTPDNIKDGVKEKGHLAHLAGALKAWEAGSNTDQGGDIGTGQQPVIVLSAPAGIISLTEQSQTLAAGQNMDLISQRDTNHTTGRRWLHNVGQHISLFVAGVKDKVAFKLIAAKGKVQLQAQSDAMELTADQDLAITSTKQKIHFNAKQEVLLTSGGAYVRIKGGKIELHAPGTISVKGSVHDWSGPDQMAPPLPQFPNNVCIPCLLKAMAARSPVSLTTPGA